MNRPKTNRWLPIYFWILFGGIGPTVYAIFKALDVAGSSGYIFFAVVIIAIRATTCWGLYTRRLWGWYLNFVALFGIPALKALVLLQTPRYSDTENAYAAGALATAFFWLVYAIPNAIYFQKRKYLFDDGKGSHKTIFDRWRVLDPQVQDAPSGRPGSSSQITAPEKCQKPTFANDVPAEIPKKNFFSSVNIQKNRDIAESAKLIRGVMAGKNSDQFIEFTDFWEGNMENMNDEKCYEMAQDEIVSGQAVQGLMLKAEIAAGGDEKKTRLIYLQARASQLYQEHLVELDAERARIHTEELEREKQQKLEREQQKAEEASSVKPNEIEEIVKLRPEMALCLQEISEFEASDPQRAKMLIEWYQKKSDQWLLRELRKVGGFRAAYGLAAIEAHRRKLNLADVVLSKLPDKLPKN